MTGGGPMVQNRTAHLATMKEILQRFLNEKKITQDQFKKAAKQGLTAKLSYPLPRSEVESNALSTLLEILPEDHSARGEVKSELDRMVGAVVAGAVEEDVVAVAKEGGAQQRKNEGFSIGRFRAHMEEARAAIRAMQPVQATATQPTHQENGGLSTASAAAAKKGPHVPQHFVVTVKGLQEVFGEGAQAAAKSMKDAIQDTLRGVALLIQTPLHTTAANETLYPGVALVRCTTEPRSNTALERITAHRWGVGSKPRCEVRQFATDAELSTLTKELVDDAASSLLAARADQQQDPTKVLETVGSSSERRRVLDGTAATAVVAATSSVGGGESSDDIYSDFRAVRPGGPPPTAKTTIPVSSAVGTVAAGGVLPLPPSTGAGAGADEEGRKRGRDDF